MGEERGITMSPQELFPSCKGSYTFTRHVQLEAQDERCSGWDGMQ